MSYATLPVAAANALDATASLWAMLGALVVAMLALDLLVFARRGAPSLRTSAAWSVGWLAVALGFGAALWAAKGGDAGAQYLAGYLLERSLSLDNVFVFAVILGYFAVPRPVQAKVLSWGIMLALVLRLVFILLGAALLDAAHVTFYVFGALLLYTAWKLARHDGEEIEPERNPALRALRRLVPMSRDYHGDRLVVRAGGGRMATPLLAVFVVVATTDVVFAVDSVPAIFAITQAPFVVFAANAFAMLGLRALYFLLAGMMDRFVHLAHGLAAILAFIGVKMLLIDVWHPPIWVSLAVIAGVLAATAALSLRAPGRDRAGDPPERRMETAPHGGAGASLGRSEV
jgi:tellurite resistance protein TerC